tara:strand:+ start:334 stop:1035 length:702 start_codon:yes stop_codon:yes gene_type:complete
MNNQTKKSASVVLDSISKSYKNGNIELQVLKNLNLTLKKGEVVTLSGPSGSGKSTLLHLLGLLDMPNSGSVNLFGESTHMMNDTNRTNFRLNNIGFMYQFHNLLPDFSALENVMIPQLISKTSRHESKLKAINMLEILGLKDRINHKPTEMSGGEQQRCAFARAIINQPKLLIADEPTGNLDKKTGENVFEIILDIVKSKDLIAIVATHNETLSKRVDRNFNIENGALYESKR